jgi:hypothetical protein
MDERSVDRRHASILTKDNLFKPTQHIGRKSRGDIQFSSVAQAEKIARDEKTARLRALRLAQQGK